MSGRADLPDHAAELRRLLVDPREVCTRLGLLDGYKPGRQAGGGLLIRCPDHGDRTPSCSVRRGADGTIAVKCQACGFAGDVLHLVAARYKLDLRRDFRDVLAEAADVAGVSLDLGEQGAGRARRPMPPLPAPAPIPRLDDDAFDRLAVDLLERCPLDAKANPDGADVVAYVAGRELLHEATRDGWGALPRSWRQQSAVVRELERLHGLEALLLGGLVALDAKTDEPNLERFAWPSNRLVVPYRAPGVAGAIDTFQRRRVDNDDSRGSKYVMTPQRAPSWPYGVEDLAEFAGEATAVAFVEGAVDVLAARALYRREGLDRIPIGIPGLQHWRLAWAELARGRVALVALDADKAGEASVARVGADLANAGASRVVRVRPLAAKDWAGELAKGTGT